MHSCRSRSAGVLRHRVAREVSGRGAADQLGRAESTRHHALLADLADPDREVESFLDEVHGSIGEIEVEAHLRMQHGELGDGRREMTVAEAHATGEAQRAARLHGRQAHRALGLLEIGQQLQGPLVEGLAGFGQREAASGAMEQARLEVRLEVRNLPRDG